MSETRLGRPPGRSIENTARRRRQLIEAAIDSIGQHGFAATTLAKVSTAAGLSQGTAVFYFKTKEALLEETLRFHNEAYRTVWRTALEQAGDDPIDRLMALAFADLDPEICTPRNLALWISFWGETVARPRYAEICDDFDGERDAVLRGLCEAAQGLMAQPNWSVETLMAALDTMMDGLWVRMHISPDYMTNANARLLLARLLASVFPSRADDILAKTEALNRALASTPDPLNSHGGARA